MESKHVFIDIATQRDFLTQQGACPVRERKALVANLRKVFALARKFHVPVVSAVETHRDSDTFAGAPPHCIEGTSGHNKLNFTLLDNRTILDANNTLDLPPGLLSNHRQVILRKRTPDFLDNPKADRLITGLAPDLIIVFGVGVEQTIKKLVLSLLARGKKVAWLPEACGYWNETDADLAQRLMGAKGAAQHTIEELREILEQASTRRPRIAPPLPKRLSPRGKRRSRTRRSLAG